MTSPANSLVYVYFWMKNQKFPLIQLKCEDSPVIVGVLSQNFGIRIAFPLYLLFSTGNLQNFHIFHVKFGIHKTSSGNWQNFQNIPYKVITLLKSYTRQHRNQ